MGWQLHSANRASTPVCDHAHVKLLRCDCGFETSADAAEELVDRALTHAREAHGIDLHPREVLSLMSHEESIRPSASTATSPSPTP